MEKQPLRQNSPITDPDVWQRIRAAVEAVVDLPAEKQNAAFRQHSLSEEEADLARTLLNELGPEDVAEGFEPSGSAYLIDRLPMQGGLEQLLAGRTTGGVRPGSRVGSWELRERIGSGGMGEVWRAVRVDGPFVQRGALKRLHDGHPDGELLARFERERQVLASIEDPGIARLIDGGLDQYERPYLVMEFIEGDPIDAWCRARSKGVRGRIELLAGVARAADAAHEHQVVHRDIKPSNVLVDGEGRPRLIDFGVAKVLDPAKDHALVTRDVARYLTPQFASPEQFLGSGGAKLGSTTHGPARCGLTTASDVYSLGALGYALLSGRPPLPILGLGPAEAVRQVTEQTPLPPSAAARECSPEAMASTGLDQEAMRLQSRLVDRDLDAVLLRCLQKEPARRYGRAGELADDLDRWLAGQPVLARHDTLTYRTVCFVRRHRTLVGLVTLTFLSMAIGLAVSIHQSLRLDRQSKELAARTAHSEVLMKDLRESVKQLTNRFYGDLAVIPGTRHVLNRLNRSLALMAERQDDPELLVEAMRAYWLFGNHLWTPFGTGTGHFDEGTDAIEKARQIGLSIFSRLDSPTHLKADVSDVLWVSANRLMQGGMLEAALERTQADASLLARAAFTTASLANEGPPASLAFEGQWPRRDLWERVVMNWLMLQRLTARIHESVGQYQRALEQGRATLTLLRSFDPQVPYIASLGALEARSLISICDDLEQKLGLPRSTLSASPTERISPAHDRPLEELQGERLEDARAIAVGLLTSGDVEAARDFLRQQGAAVQPRTDAVSKDRAEPSFSGERARLNFMAAELEDEYGDSNEAARLGRLALTELLGCVQDRQIAWCEERELAIVRLLCGQLAIQHDETFEGARLLTLVLEHSDRSLRMTPRDWQARLLAVDAECGLAELESKPEARRKRLKSAEERLAGVWTDAPNSAELQERRDRISRLQ